MRKAIALMIMTALATVLTPSTAEACGGFFCSQAPVDQNGERVIFTVEEDSVTMTVALQYTGKAQDFTALLPVNGESEISAESLKVIPLAAVDAVDRQTAIGFRLPDGCWVWDDVLADADGGAPPMAAGEGPRDEGGVMVHLEETVGPYNVAVISGDDTDNVVSWLRENSYRVSNPMVPYIGVYVEQEMKFLAMKLTSDADVGDIEPFQFTMDGTNTPMIPLTLTMIAMEPNMPIDVVIFGDQNYAGANYENFTIEPEDISWRMNGWEIETNWDELIARKVDAAGGHAWLTEVAGDLAPMRELAERPVGTPEQEEAQEAVLGFFRDKERFVRLTTRVAAEDVLGLDPVFRRAENEDVERFKQLAAPDDPSVCEGGGMSGGEDVARGEACDFTNCGAAGACVEVQLDDGSMTTGCGCAPGTTARTVREPDGESAVTCQDARLSFVNPGDDGMEDLGDPCVGFSCGAGTCVSMNMTPTCVCDAGMAAVGWFNADGDRRTTCLAPMRDLPESLQAIQLPPIPEQLQVGRDISEIPGMPSVAPSDDNTGCSVGSTNSGSNAAGALFALFGLVAFARRRRN